MISEPALPNQRSGLWEGHALREHTASSQLAWLAGMKEWKHLYAIHKSAEHLPLCGSCCYHPTTVETQHPSMAHAPWSAHSNLQNLHPTKLTRHPAALPFIAIILCFFTLSHALSEQDSSTIAPASDLSLSAEQQSLKIPPSGLTLASNWNKSLQGAQKSVTELDDLLKDLASPELNLSLPEHPIYIYKKVTYLMPFRDSLKELQLEGRLPSRNSLASPGFPKDSFFYYTFSGKFEDIYNLMVILVDKADQVISIQLVCETPRLKNISSGNSNWILDDWKNYRFIDYYDSDRVPESHTTYNFINLRKKAAKRLRVLHEIKILTTPDSREYKEKWLLVKSNYSSQPTNRHSKVSFDIILVSSTLVDPGRDSFSDPKILEISQWFLPLPLAQTILYNIQKNASN